MLLHRRLDRIEKERPSLFLNERDADALRKQEKRAESARIIIPPCVNQKRREACLADVEKFLRTYFASDYTREFTKLHRGLWEAMIEVATTGGEQAVAAPRGRGKTQITKGVICYLIFAGLVRFPVVVSQTTDHAREIYEDFRRKCSFNELLLEDFPEICYPVRALEGAPQRASRQHVDGQLTRIEWKAERLRLASIPEDSRIGADYGGVRMEFRGLDAAIRGINRDGDRPDYVCIDEPETRESAKSTSQIDDRRNALDKDVAGLAGEDHELAQVMLTTLQNNYCLSAEFTDPERRPSWMGKRFGWVEKWPEEYPLGEKGRGMWHEYIEIRGDDQRKGDRYGRSATQFYLDNREQMESGGKLLSDNFKSKTLPDGWQTTHSAWQEIFNFIADKSFGAFCTEYQNDPPKETGPEGLGLTAEIVGSRLSGLSQRQVPANTTSITAAIDLGKFACHWVVCAWWKGAGGCVVDYGIAEVSGTEGINSGDQAADMEASEPHIYRALLRWRDDLLGRDFVDASGVSRKVDRVFVDSGTYTNAAYEFCRQTDDRFHAAKGIGNYKPRKNSTKTLKAGDNMHASYQDAQNLWLFDLNSDYWKNWVHERFLAPTFDESNMLQPGALSLFQPSGGRTHRSFCQHIVAEELVTEFVEGKGTKVYWHQHNRNNHWLDAMYYAAAAGRLTGVDLLTGSAVQNRPVPKVDRPKQQRPKRQHGTRPNNGWMQRFKRG